ncbi:chromatin binding protein [Thecaphora frezii]
MNAQLLNPFAQPIPDSVSATLNNTDATLCRFNRGRTIFSGQYLAVGQLDGSVAIWDVETRAVLRVLEGHIRPVSSISWSACNRYLATASADWNVIIWDLAASSANRRSAMQPAESGPSNLGDAADAEMEELDRAPRADRKRTIRFDAPVASAEFSPNDSRRLLVVLETQEAFLVDMREKVKIRRKRRLRRPEAMDVDEPQFRNEGVLNGAANAKSSAVGEEELFYEDVKCWPTRMPLRTTTAPPDATLTAKPGGGGITAAKYSPQADRIFAGTSKGAILIFDAATAELLAEHKVLGTTSGVRELAFDRSGRHLVVNTNDRAVRILNVVTSVRSREEASRDATATDTSAVGAVVAVAAKRRKVETELVMLHKYQDLVNRTPWNGIGFSGDSDYVVGGAAHKAAHNVYIWDRSAGTLVKILEGPKDSLIDVDWHPERPMLASVSNTGSIYIWFTATEEIWSAYAPGFEELEENVEYAEREDEFDLEDEEEVTRRKQDEEEALVNILSLGPAGIQTGAAHPLTLDDASTQLSEPVQGTDTGWRDAPTSGDGDVTAEAARAVNGTGTAEEENAETSEWIWQEREVVCYVEDDDVNESFVIPPCLE